MVNVRSGDITINELPFNKDEKENSSRTVWKPGEEAWVKSFDLVSTGDIVRPGSKNLTHG